MSIVSLAHGISLEKKHQSNVFTFSRLRHRPTRHARIKQVNSWENWQADSFKGFAFLVLPFEDPSLKLLKTAAGIFVRIEAFLEVAHPKDQISSYSCFVSCRFLPRFLEIPHRQLHPNVHRCVEDPEEVHLAIAIEEMGERERIWMMRRVTKRKVTRRRRRDVTATEDAAMPSPEREGLLQRREDEITTQEEHTQDHVVVFVVRVDEIMETKIKVIL